MEELDIDNGREFRVLSDDLLRIQTRKRCIMRMDTLHRDTVGRRSGRLGESLAKLHMSRVQQPCPVDRAQHDRLPRPQDHEANRLQRLFDFQSGLDPASAQRVPQRRGGIKPKRRQLQTAKRLLRPRRIAEDSARQQPSCGVSEKLSTGHVHIRVRFVKGCNALMTNISLSLASYHDGQWWEKHFPAVEDWPQGLGGTDEIVERSSE